MPTPFQALLNRIMQTPATDKLEQFARDWNEADELEAIQRGKDEDYYERRYGGDDEAGEPA